MNALVVTNTTVVNAAGKKAKQNVCVIGDTITSVGSQVDISLLQKLFKTQISVIDGTNLYLVPGLIDSHSHILGASGESSYSSRAPEIPVTALINSGITTVVGLLGLDTITRSHKALVAKVRALESEGITARMLTGSYHLPPATALGSIKEDIYLLPEVLGVGEVAISDYRSSQPTIQELQKLAKETFVAATAKGIPGVVVFHTGDEITGLEVVNSFLRGTNIPEDKLILTHVNRNSHLLASLKQWKKRDCWIDLTAIYFKKNPNKTFIHVEDAVRNLIKMNFPLEKVTISSDSGCLIEENTLTQPAWFLEAFQTLVKKKILTLSQAVQLFSANPAKALGLSAKGSIEEGKNADFLLLNKNCELESVVAKGKFVLRDRKLLSHGFYGLETYY